MKSSNLELVLQHNPQGGLYLFTEELGRAGYNDSKLSQFYAFEEWWQLQQDMLGDTQNVEIALKNQENKLVGGVVLVAAEDAQVGPCMTLFHQFLMKPYRGDTAVWRQMYRLAVEVTREAGFSFLVHSHRLSHNVFKTFYRQV